MTNAQFRLHLYTAAPTCANGDNGAWSTDGAANYIGAFDVSSGSGWHQITAESEAPTYAMRAPIGSRRERRRTPRDHWFKSTPATLKVKGKGA